MWLATYRIKIRMTIVALRNAAVNPAINIGRSWIVRISQLDISSKMDAAKIIGIAR